MSPETLVALRLLSEAVFYAAHDSEHAAWPLLKLDGLLDVVEGELDTAPRESLDKLRAVVDAMSK